MAKGKKGGGKKLKKHVRKKRDAIHGKRKGEKGEAAQYITRAQALGKLQVSLADFRKLCILKGIYPRDPKKKSAGNDKTYYHTKDIAFLSHEPLLQKFFELKTFMKKFKRLMGRQEIQLAKGLESRKPKLTLSHLVRERYPSFDDALRDLDDAVSMLALFQALSASQKLEIPTEAVNEASRLYQEFQLYVIKAQALRKVFASIKGYYFQADINGVIVTWLAPHQFNQALPPEVDFRVMITFLEFYRAVLKFVNFRLYSELGLAYPPKRILRRDESSAAEVAALEAEMREAGKAREALVAQGAKDDADVATGVAADFGEQSQEVQDMHKQLLAASRMKSTFRGLKVFVNREVPLRPVYFTLLCGGVAEVGWERGASGSKSAGHGSAFGVENTTITHQIVDRPPDHLETRQGREYVQPQWVFDSFNVGCLLPIAPYAPGRTPPPHLSPFVDDRAEGYVPRQREVLDRFAAEVAGVSAPVAAGTEAGPAAAPTVAPPVDAFDRFAEELRAESKGTWHSAFREQQMQQIVDRATEGMAVDSADGDQKTAEDMEADGEEGLKLQPVVRPTEEEEEKLRAKALMSKKHKRLLFRIEKSAQNKNDKNARLLQKRREAESKSGKQ